MISWINFDFVHLNYYDVFHILLTAGRNELPPISLCVSTSARTGLLLEYNPSCGWTQSVGLSLLDSVCCQLNEAEYEIIRQADESAAAVVEIVKLSPQLLSYS